VLDAVGISVGPDNRTPAVDRIPVDRSQVVRSRYPVMRNRGAEHAKDEQLFVE
jgi:hypothetical protein